MKAIEPFFTGCDRDKILGSDVSAGLVTVVSSLKLFLLVSFSLSVTLEAPILLLLSVYFSNIFS